jgi:hypothetical protein
MKSNLPILLIASLLVAYSAGLPTFTQTYLPRAFGPTGDLLGVEQIWAAAAILTTKFSTDVKDDHYMQGANLVWSRSSSKPSAISLTTDTIQVGSPGDFSGAMDFIWTTYKEGIFRDSVVETGAARINFVVTQYKYDIKFVKSSGKYVGTISNFNCTFDINGLPTLDGNPGEISKDLSPDLRKPIEDTLNNYYCPKVKTTLQTTVTNWLKVAQTQQTLSWKYGTVTPVSKKLPLQPNSERPFENGKFVIIGNGTLAQDSPSKHDHTIIETLKHYEDSILVSDSNLGEQVDDICVIINKDLINEMVQYNIDYYKKYSIVVNGASGGQKYYPFNVWQFWEVTLYDLIYYEKMGTEEGKYTQTDPFSINCAYQGGVVSTVTEEGYIDVKANFNCTVQLTDSNNKGAIVELYNFTYELVSAMSFYMEENYLNAKIDNADVSMVSGITLNSQDILEDVANRIEKPFIDQMVANVKLFGTPGIKLDFIVNRQLNPSLVGEDLQICFK